MKEEEVCDWAQLLHWVVTDGLTDKRTFTPTGQLRHQKQDDT